MSCPPRLSAASAPLVVARLALRAHAIRSFLVAPAAMASPASARGAVRAAPPPDELAAFLSLVDKKISAAQLSRHARDAELSSKAAEKAEALFGNDSLVVAHLRMNESIAVANLASSARGAEQVTLFRRSWSALLPVIAHLQRRLATNTVLPGTVRTEESDYYAHVAAAIFAAQDKLLPLPADLQTSGVHLQSAYPCFSMRCTEV